MSQDGRSNASMDFGGAIRMIIHFAATTAILLSFLAGVATLLVQVYWFLDSGEWTALQFRLMYAYGPELFENWVIQPKAWFGLHKIIVGFLGEFPLSFGLLLPGVFIGTILSRIAAAIKKD